MREKWELLNRPGYFGRRRDEKIAALDAVWGKGKWGLRWIVKFPSPDVTAPDEVLQYDFATACKFFYEESYYRYLKARPEDVDFICSFGECIDNAETNVESGLDYDKQEAFSTHIQDIAVRNVLVRLGRKFEDPNRAKLLVIRSQSDNGYRFNPGNIPFFDKDQILTPSLSPRWAQQGSVEDFWQSNKFIVVNRAG